MYHVIDLSVLSSLDWYLLTNGYVDLIHHQLVQLTL